MAIQTDGSPASIDSGPLAMPSEGQPTASFLPGQIISLRVFQFMSLDNYTFTFGPEINILDGPEASDMQSVLLAIHVGLGGRYSDSQLDKMIKVNLSHFTIEISLKRPGNKKDLLIQRTHQHTEPYTAWMIDQRPANIDMVIKSLAALKIDVESKLDWMLTAQFEEVYEQICSPQELLMLTEKTVSKPDIVTLHKKLLKLEDERADAARQVYRIKLQIKKRRNAKVDAQDGLKVIDNASLADAESALHGMQSKLKQIEGKIDNKTKLWRKGTRRMAENLPHLFRSSLVYLSRDGKMKLVTSGGLANWGLEIYIQNSLSWEEQLLTHQSHSGHDRSIAMASVMMTLHRLSTSPIRFFDGVNNGISQEWKEYILELLVIEVARQKKVQFFISSSSLDPERVVPSSTVHTVRIGFPESLPVEHGDGGS